MFIADMYTAHILKATGGVHIPQASWENVRVFLPYSQKRRIVQDGAFDVSNQYRGRRIFPEALAAAAGHSVMLFRPSMCKDLENAGCLAGSCVVYSMWEDYLDEERQKPFLAWLAARDIHMHKCHTSGHASLVDLRRLRNAFAGAVVVPVHCADPDAFAQAFDRTAIHKDNEWWEVSCHDNKEE